MEKMSLSRRGLFGFAGLCAAGLALSGCGVGDTLSESPAFADFKGKAEGLTQASQRLLLSNARLAREFGQADLSPTFKANGTIRPSTPEYLRLLEANFTDWRLRVYGLVERPQALSMAQLKAMPARSQITRHDCVEGWSAIGQWTGTALINVLRVAGLRPNARYIVFHCADNLGGEAQKGGDLSMGRYYESIDLFDAFHPQTILAYGMNGADLTVAHGAPLRLRVERQLGYKHAKYLLGIEATDSLARYGRGKGGYWEDRGYEWYAGI
jgi:DMSO/TMAO reductase YedYZ molybdopterin-dependent catalytic subunit